MVMTTLRPLNHRYLLAKLLFVPSPFWVPQTNQILLLSLKICLENYVCNIICISIKRSNKRREYKGITLRYDMNKLNGRQKLAKNAEDYNLNLLSIIWDSLSSHLRDFLCETYASLTSYMLHTHTHTYVCLFYSIRDSCECEWIDMNYSWDNEIKSEWISNFFLSFRSIHLRMK